MKKIIMCLMLMVSLFVNSFGADKSLENVKKKGYYLEITQIW